VRPSEIALRDRVRLLDVVRDRGEVLGELRVEDRLLRREEHDERVVRRLGDRDVAVRLLRRRVHADVALVFVDDRVQRLEHRDVDERDGARRADRSKLLSEDTVLTGRGGLVVEAARVDRDLVPAAQADEARGLVGPDAILVVRHADVRAPDLFNALVALLRALGRDEEAGNKEKCQCEGSQSGGVFGDHGCTSILFRSGASMCAEESENRGRGWRIRPGTRGREPIPTLDRGCAYRIVEACNEALPGLEFGTFGCARCGQDLKALRESRGLLKRAAPIAYRALGILCPFAATRQGKTSLFR
jgi:hypothetical protein